MTQALLDTVKEHIPQGNLNNVYQNLKYTPFDSEIPFLEQLLKTIAMDVYKNWAKVFITYYDNSTF